MIHTCGACGGCLSFLPIAMIRYLEKQIKGEWIYYGSQFKVIVHHHRKAQWQDLERTVHVTSTVRIENSKVLCVFISSF